MRLILGFLAMAACLLGFGLWVWGENPASHPDQSGSRNVRKVQLPNLGSRENSARKIMSKGFDGEMKSRRDRCRISVVDVNGIALPRASVHTLALGTFVTNDQGRIDITHSRHEISIWAESHDLRSGITKLRGSEDCVLRCRASQWAVGKVEAHPLLIAALQLRISSMKTHWVKDLNVDPKTGEFRSERLGAGSYELKGQIRKDTVFQYQLDVSDDGSGGPLRVPTLRLPPRYQVALVKVIDYDGTVAPDILIQLEYSALQEPLTRPRERRTDSKGEYRFAFDSTQPPDLKIAADSRWVNGHRIMSRKILKPQYPLMVQLESTSYFALSFARGIPTRLHSSDTHASYVYLQSTELGQEDIRAALRIMRRKAPPWMSTAVKALTIKPEQIWTSLKPLPRGRYRMVMALTPYGKGMGKAGKVDLGTLRLPGERVMIPHSIPESALEKLHAILDG